MKQNLIFLSIVFLLVTFLFYSGCNFDDRITKSTDEEIKNSPVLKELESLCNEIPLPNNFKFVRKSGLDDQIISLVYVYASETAYEDTRKDLDEYFFKNNWKITKENLSYPKTIEFRNDKNRVFVQYEGLGENANYAVTCEKITKFTY